MSTKLFIVGCPRSGTTILAKLLNIHPNISIGIERFNIRVTERKLSSSDFSKERFFDLQPGDTWYDSLDHFKSDYDRLRSKYDVTNIFGDTFPRGYNYIDHLSSVGSDVRFIFCFRDVFEVADSFERQKLLSLHWDNSWDFRRAIEMWNKSISEAQRWISYLPVLPIYHGDLLREPAQIARKIAKFLDVDPRPLLASANMLQRLPSQKVALPAQARQIIQQEANFGGLASVLAYGASPVSTSSLPQHLSIGLRDTVARYEHVDRDIMDYAPWRSPNCRFMFRGPAPSARIEESIVFLGSAATYGRFVERPVAQIISEKTGIPTINFGFGGARPSLYLGEPYIQDALRRCRLAVVEVMSARGYSTDLFTPLNPWTNLGKALPIIPGIKDMIGQAAPFGDHVYDQALANCSFFDFCRIAAQIRIQYISDMKKIAEISQGRNLLFYFSQREPDYMSVPLNWARWAGDFPHFVDENTLKILKPIFSSYAESISSTGLPQLLSNRHTGEPIEVYPPTGVPSTNTYYPSPEMHIEAAEALLPALMTQLRATSRLGGS
jgi:hypothetical protein